MTSNQLWNTFHNVKAAFDNDNSNNNNDDESNSDEENFTESDRPSINHQVSKPTECDEKCTECLDGSLIQNEGRLVCQNCGVDNGQVIDYTQEWRLYGSGNDGRKRSDPTRCGMSSGDLLPGATLGTILLGRGNELYRRLHKWNQMTYKEKSMITDFNEFRDKCLQNNIPVSVLDKTKALYRALRYDDSLYDMKRGTTKKGLMAACAYESCKNKGISKSPKEISEIFEIKINKVTNGIKDFKKLMHCKDLEYAKNMKATTPKDYIEYYGNKIGMNPDHIKTTLYVSHVADLLGIVPENIPHSMAIGCLYLTIAEYNLEYNKKYLAQQCQISEVTISKTCKKLEPFKKYLFPTPENLKNFNITNI